MTDIFRYPQEDRCLELRNGDCLTQAEFHGIYCQLGEDFRAELLGGTVFVAQPLKRLHARGQVNLAAILAAYAGATPGVECCDNATVILGEDDEVQPDLLLRILPEYRGQSHTTQDDYIEGAPELIAEVAYSSRAIDLHLKRKRYLRAGVLEYIVMCLDPREIRWFSLAAGRMLGRCDDGIYRSKIFPGLWIHNDGLLNLDYQKVFDTLNQGLSSQEHSAFVSKLAGQLQQ